MHRSLTLLTTLALTACGHPARTTSDSTAADTTNQSIGTLADSTPVIPDSAGARSGRPRRP